MSKAGMMRYVLASASSGGVADGAPLHTGTLGDIGASGIPEAAWRRLYSVARATSG